MTLRLVLLDSRLQSIASKYLLCFISVCIQLVRYSKLEIRGFWLLPAELFSCYCVVSTLLWRHRSVPSADMMVASSAKDTQRLPCRQATAGAFFEHLKLVQLPVTMWQHVTQFLACSPAQWRSQAKYLDTQSRQINTGTCIDGSLNLQRQ